MRLIVGLGNPGAKYAGNRHNVGFMAVDRLVDRHAFGVWRSRFQGQTADGTLAGEKLLILKPATFMNESGRAVGEAARFFKLSPADVIVVYDELDLAPTKVKVKQGGGHGGHNGLKSIDAHLGQDYWRVRIGIGHPGNKAKVVGHVLSDFAKAEWPMFDRLLDAVSGRFDLMVAGKTSDFASKLASDLKASAPKAGKPEAGKSEAPKSDAPRAPGKETRPSGDSGGDATPGGLAGQLKRWLGGGERNGG